MTQASELPAMGGGRARALPASLGALAALVAALLFGPAQPAAAQTELLASEGAWFWSSNEKVTTCVSAAGVCGALGIDDGPNFSGIGGPSNSLNPISTGHLAVSMKNGSSDMRAFVKFDLAPLTRDVPFGSALEFSDFKVRLTVSHPTDSEHAQQHAGFEGRPPATANQESAAIMACAVTQPWAKAEGDPTTSTTVLPPDPTAERDEIQITTDRNEPLFDCGRQALGTSSKDGSVWTFDITDIANQWADLTLFNEGIALVPVDQNLLSTWTLEFHGPPLTVRNDTETVVVVPKALAAQAEVAFAVVPEEPAPTQGPPGPAGTPGPAGPTVVQPGGGDAGGGPIVQQPTGGQITRVSQSGAAETPAWLYGLIPLGLLGLGLTSSAIGADGSGALVTHRVAQTLRARRVGDEPGGALTDSAEG